jgi:aminoglycoside 3-N-acetyltransferase
MTYTYNDLLQAYGRVGVEKDQLIYLRSDLGRLMERYEVPDKDSICGAHVRAIQELIGPDGTIVMGAETMNLCNTDTVFDPATTPSDKMGPLTEYVRKLPGAVRSFHPFGSYCAVGKRAHELLDNVSRHAFGPNTPEERMIEADALCVSIGKHPRFTCTTVHHVEQITSVPYRYTKEFMHRVMRDGEIVEEPFYLYVYYRELDLLRDENRKIFNQLEKSIQICEAPIGRGAIYAYALGEFFKETMGLFLKDPYIWCKSPPTVRPYRN